jgi:hypothetical protein
MILRALTPLSHHEVVEAFCRRLPAACTGFLNDPVEVIRGISGQFPSVLVAVEALLARTEELLV